MNGRPGKINSKSAGGYGPAIIVMAKAPVAGLVKTRLAEAMSPGETAKLAACFIADTVSGAKQTGVPVLLAYSPEGGRSVIEPITGSDVHWICQQGADLGARMLSAFYHAAGLGFTPLVMVGTDSPNLPLASYQAALDALCHGDADTVLGRSDDGGYYLIGMKALCPGLLAGVSWSGPTVYAQTMENAERLGLRVREIAPWYDVDTPDDLQRLRQDLLGDPDGMTRAPATCRWLRSR